MAKCLWSYLVDKCDCIGLIDLDLEAAAFHIGSTIKECHLVEIDSRLQRLKNGKIFIPKFIHFQYGKLSEDCRAHIPVMRAIEFHGIVTLDGIAYQYPIDRVSIPSKTGTRQDKVQEKVGGTGGRRIFQKPEMSDLQTYASKIQLPVLEIQKFYDYYESNGWKVGRNPMKNWEAAMRNWKTNVRSNGKTNGTSEFWQASKELELVEKELKAILARASTTAFDTHIEPQDKPAYDRLVKRKKELKTQLHLK